MKYFKKLIGENIYLSPLNSQDLKKFVEWLNDFETTDYTGRSSTLTTLEDEKQYLEKSTISNTNKRQFGIISSKEDILIGTIGLHDIDYINRKATLGIFIGDKQFRSKGYGIEAIKLILDFGFNYLNLNNIKLDLMEFNEGALKCYKKCGFKEYGRRRKSVYINGKYYDTICMDILSCEFKENYIKNKNI